MSRIKTIKQKNNIPVNQFKLEKKISKLLGLEPDKPKLLENKKNKLASLVSSYISKKNHLDIVIKSINRTVKSIENKVFDSNEKQIEKLSLIVDKIEELEKEVSEMTQEEMRNLVAELKIEFQKKLPPNQKLFLEKSKQWLQTKQGKEIYKFIIEKLPLCFALVREVALRTSNHRHFRVQLMAGIALSQGKIIEFKTGEGKTLVAPLALFLYSLFGRGAYLVTVNDYLARRDGEWIGHMLGYLGITVGILNNGKSYKYVDPDLLKYYGKTEQEILLAKNINWSRYNELKGLTLVETTKKDAYLCDITYGTNSEFGFDYLRDNKQFTFEDMNQRDPFFCIIDEVDSVLIDEARVPLIISDISTESGELYIKFAKLVKQLEKGDYIVDEKDRAVVLTKTGIKKMENWLNVDNIWENHEYAKHLDRALMAEYYYKKDDHYIVANNEVIIVDEFTGRLQIGRRYSDGIHQAIEAKEGLPIRPESRTVATVTYQNYFRLFPILSGMTGTALTEAEEFGKIYNLEVVVIPTNKPMIRIDLPDIIYKNEDSKFRAIVKDIIEKNQKGQPILVGTVSVEKSEKLSKMLTQAGIKHEVLNAKNHAREAEIIAKAGEKKAVTISTNMAGRGTDIRLGEGVKELGGLYVIGTERHESRRIDNQLRGRSGRQGDPGLSRFYLAFDDEILRVYGGDLFKRIASLTNLPDDLPFESKFLTRSIEAAQKRIEAENFDIRKDLVKYDDVLNKQRLVIYNRRRKIIELFDEARQYYFKNKDHVDNLVENSAIPEGMFRLRDYVIRKLRSKINYLVATASDKDYLTPENIDDLLNNIYKLVPIELFNQVILNEFNTTLEEYHHFLSQNLQKVRLKEQLTLIIDEAYDLKEKQEGFLSMREIEKYVMLDTIDYYWIDHLRDMEVLRSGISFQGYGQRDPLNIYQNEGYKLFAQMIEDINNEICNKILNYTTRIEKVAYIREVASEAKKQARLSQQKLEESFKERQTKKKK